MADKKQKAPLTNKQYVKKGGNCCPFCGSTNIEGEGVDVQEGSAQQEVTCQDCFASWFDEYNLVGYTIINGPETKDEGGDGE